MRFTLQIDMDNAAFEDDPLHELCKCVERSMRAVSNNCDEQGGEVTTDGDRPIRDTNGNRVGVWRIEE